MDKHINHFIENHGGADRVELGENTTRKNTHRVVGYIEEGCKRKTWLLLSGKRK